MTRSPLRAGLWALAALTLALGLFALLWPAGFYRHVVGVDLLGAYNAHLLTDVGGLYLGFAVAFAWAARTLSRDLVRAVCAGFVLTQVLHLVFHFTHLRGFTVAEAILQSVGLLLLTAAPLACLWLTRTDEFRSPTPS